MDEIKNSATENIDLLQFGRALLKKWFLIVCMGVIAAIIGFIYSSFFITPLYSARSTMLVDLRNSVHDDLSSEQVNIAQKYVDTFAYIMETNTVLEPIIQELDLNESVSSLAAKLHVSPVEDTLLIKVSIQHYDREIALDIIKELDKKAPEIINQRITSGYIIEVESPTASTGPVSPNVTRYTIMGGVAGVLFMVFIIIVLEFFNNRVKSVAELQRVIDVPILGVIPSTANLDSTGKGA